MFSGAADIKVIAHSKMKMIPRSTHPQAIPGAHDPPPPDEPHRSHVQKRPGSSKLYNGSEWVLFFNSPKEVQ